MIPAMGEGVGHFDLGAMCLELVTIGNRMVDGVATLRGATNYPAVETRSAELVLYTIVAALTCC